MNETAAETSWVIGLLRAFAASWKSLLTTDAIYKLLSLILWLPFVGLLTRALLALSGTAAVSDMDVLFFLLGPFGWAVAVLGGGLLLAVFALEQAALLRIIAAKDLGRSVTPIQALRFSLARALPVLALTSRLVAWTLLTVVPFLATLGIAYVLLLTQYDINYYLQQRPPAFWIAVAFGLVIVLVLAGVLLRLVCHWFLALPLVIFEGVPAGEALRRSRELAQGLRKTMLIRLLAWLILSGLLSSIATGLTSLLAHLIIPDQTEALRFITLSIGILLLTWALTHLLVGLLAATSLACVLFQVYKLATREDLGRLIESEIDSSGQHEFAWRLTPGRLLVGLACGVLVAIAVVTWTLHSIQVEDQVQIMAHRGSSFAAPENTLAAFKLAIDEQADWIELDVQETADGDVVIMHDSDFMKLASRDLKIWNATRDDLEEVDIGSWFAPEFASERVPTLGEVLDLCRGKIGVIIELKYYGHDEALEQRVAELVDARKMASDVMVMSLKQKGIQKMKSVRPDWKVGLLLSVSMGDPGKIDADFLAVNATFASRNLIRTAHRAGKEVYVWTVDDAATMSMLISRGVDGILTNRPALARSVLEQRAAMSAPERLLLEFAFLFGDTPKIRDQ